MHRNDTISAALDADGAGEGPTEATSLQTLQLPGKVWALALHSHLLAVGGALASEADGNEGHA